MLNILARFWLIACISSSAFASSLAELDSALGESDLSVLRAESKVQISKAREDQANASLGPQLNASVSSVRNDRKQSNRTERYLGEEYSLTLNQPLFNEPASLDPLRQAAVTRGSKFALERTAQERRIELVSAFVAWVDADSQLKFMNRRLSSVGQRAFQLEKLFERQQVSVVEVLTVNSERDRVRANIAQVEANQGAASSALVNLLGDESLLGETPALDDVASWPFDGIAGSLTEAPLETHPSVLEAKSNRQASGLALRQAEAATLPVVSVQVRMSDSNIGSNNSETPPVRNFSAQATITWGIFDSGAKEARLRESQFFVEDSELALEQTLRQIRQERQASETEIRRIRRAWDAALAEVRSAEQLLKAAERSYDLGVGTIGNTLSALERLVEAEIRLSSRWLEGFLGVARLAQMSNQLDRTIIDRLSGLMLR